MTPSVVRFYRLLGPGILFAAAAIGVSHLVQSTRAGAAYGLAMIPILLAACIAKYPSLLIGLLYPAHTGKTLLHSYRQQGWWAIALYLVMVLYAMWFTLAAITVTTAGIWQALIGSPADVRWASALVLGLAAAILLSGRYQGLEHVSKWLLGLLAMLLPVATLLVLPAIDFSVAAFTLGPIDLPTVAFIIALTGWMPIPVDASVMSSVWAASRNETAQADTSPAEATLDFNVGFTLAALFAVCFVLLGAGVLHANGTELPNAAGPFAAKVIDLFTSQLGEWSFYLIGPIAFITLFTTLLTVLDGQVRVLGHAVRLYRPQQILTPRIYSAGILVFAMGGLLVIVLLMRSFTTFISYATSLGFLLAPAIVILNHRAMFSAEATTQFRPPEYLYWWSIIGGAVLCAASAVYFYLAFAG